MDYFKTDWTTTMKTNPTANFLLNNGYKVKKWLEYRPIMRWRDMNDNKLKTNTMGNVRNYKYGEDITNMPPYLNRKTEAFDFIEVSEVEKNPNYNVYEDEKDKVNDKINWHKSRIGTKLGQWRLSRAFEPQTMILGLSDEDRQIRDDNDFPEPSFWVNTAPTMLYKTSNTQLRPNPFASISNSSIQVSTPLITFST